MPTRERPEHRGARIARRLLFRIGDELRIARVGAGLSSRFVASRVGISHTQVLRIERAAAPHVEIGTLARLAAVLGLDLSLSAYPVTSPIRDAAHIALLERLHARLPATIRWRVEVPMPLPGDLRCADATVIGKRVDAFVEAETHVHDAQAVVRSINAKQRDLGSRRAILLLLDSRYHRDLLRSTPVLMDRFPVGTRQALSALSRGLDPGGDALIIL